MLLNWKKQEKLLGRKSASTQRQTSAILVRRRNAKPKNVRITASNIRVLRIQNVMDQVAFVCGVATRLLLQLLHQLYRLSFLNFVDPILLSTTPCYHSYDWRITIHFLFLVQHQHHQLFVFTDHEIMIIYSSCNYFALPCSIIFMDEILLLLGSWISYNGC